MLDRLKRSDVALRWVQPPLTNGWANFNTSLKVAYTKDPMGFVHLRGSATRSAGSSALPIFTLPNGYRPGQQEIFPALAITAALATVAVRLDVATNGQVAVITGDGSVLTSLSGVTFRAEQ